jgi:hypothetical protein
MVGVSKLPMQQGSADDFQTPEIALDCLIPYLKKEWKIWECACGKGNIVIKLEKEGFNVMGTDILQGFDFIEGSTWEKFDCIVTNPPYSLKEKFLERCYEIGKPFALLMPLTALESEKRQKLYRKYGLQLIIPNKRFNFETPSGSGGGELVCYCLVLWKSKSSESVKFCRGQE